MTGLLNPWDHSKFRPELAAPWLESLPNDAVFLLLGLRGFRRVNAEHGVRAGDRVLAEAGRRLSACTHPWPAYRIGGDEFLVAARLPSEADIRSWAGTVRSELERPYELATLATWAAAACAFADESPERLFRALDRAFTAVTQNGWSELLIAPPEADETTWFDRPGT